MLDTGSRKTLKRAALLYIALILVCSALYHYRSQIDQEAWFLAQKTNVLNRIFVKKGWFWTSLAYCLAVAVNRPLRRTVLIRSCWHYALATVYWIFFTQWFFGPPVMDRIFMLTGGSCFSEVGDLRLAHATSYECRVNGGNWSGGHDPSGHIFLLVHSSLLLWREVLCQLADLQPSQPVNFSIKICLVEISVWGFMLINTVLYFHSVRETCSGLAFALVYFCFITYVDRHLYAPPIVREAAYVEQLPEKAEDAARETNSNTGLSTGCGGPSVSIYEPDSAPRNRASPSC